MGTTVEELKRLYTKLGGKDKQVATFNQPGEVLNAINEIDLPTDYELPKVTTEDAGKILGVNDEGKWDAETPTKELPAVTSEDEGKVLTVDSEGAWGAETPAKELPAVTSEDTGKVLTVDSEGAWGAETPSGGGGLPEVTSEDNGDVLTVVDGAWNKVNMGTGITIFDSKYTSGLAGVQLSDGKKIIDIINAIKAHKIVMIRITSVSADSEKRNVIFSNPYYYSGINERPIYFLGLEEGGWNAASIKILKFSGIDSTGNTGTFLSPT